MMNNVSRSLFDDDPVARDDRKLSDLVDALCRATLPEERVHLAIQLRNTVDNVTEIVPSNLRASFETDHVHERGPAVAAMTRRLHSMLTSDSVHQRLAAIEAFKALISTESESLHARTQRTSNAIRVLFSTNITDIATAAAAAKLVSVFSQEKSPMTARAVNFILHNALSMIINPVDENPNPQLSMDRARAAMVITELATQDKTQNLIFVKHSNKLRKDMWHVCWDNDEAVREQGVKAMQAIITATINRAETSAAERAMCDAMEIIRASLSQKRDPSPTPSCLRGTARTAMAHGSLSMLGSLLSAEGTRSFMHAFSEELCDLVLPYQKCPERQSRQVVAEILPLLVKLDNSRFAERFLDSVLKSTLTLIRNEKFPADERGRSLVSLSIIAEQLPRNDDSSLLEDLLKVCRDALCAPHRLILPQSAVVTTISHTAKASRGSPVFERAVRDGILTILFNTNFTNDLVDAVNEIGRALPTFAGPIRVRLVHLIAATLKRGLPSRKDGLLSISSASSAGDNLYDSTHGSSINSCVTRTGSFLSLQHASPNFDSAQRTRQKVPLSRVGPPRNNGTEVLQKRKRTSARDFFRQVPISQELHRIDSSSILISKRNVRSLDGLMKKELMALSNSNRSSLLAGTGPPMVDDRENSPCVALKAILNFEFSDMHVQDFISLATEFVIGYVEYNSVKVRALAVAASAKLMVSAATLWAGPSGGRRRPNQLRRGVHTILEQILALAVADPSTDVRYVAIRFLDEQIFHPYMLQPEMLNKLFLCFHDESLAMRNSALSLAGRISKENPAKILPELRNYLTHLLTLLRCDGDFFAKDRREATELLYILVHDSSNLVMPYTTSLMSAILLRLQEAKRANDASLARPALLALAEMGGTMSRIDLARYENELVPLLIGSVLEAQLSDPFYKKAAIRALTAFVQNAGLAIKPYIFHRQLLSELIHLLIHETDPDARILTGILLGSLGAVDPTDNKYAAIIDYDGRRQGNSKDCLTASGSQSQPIFRAESFGVHGAVQLGLSAKLKQTRGFTLKSTFSHLNCRRQVDSPSSGGVLRKFQQVQGLQGNISGRSTSKDARSGENSVNTIKEEVVYSISLFAFGGTRVLELISNYCPCWAEDGMLKDSLIGLLEHPFTASPDFFPSAALDILHKIIGNPSLQVHHREACQAIVGILKSAGPKCVNFSSAVVPRILWLLAQSSSADSRYELSFTQLQQHIMHRLADIIATTGHNFMPFTFDTVLLVWYLLDRAKNSVACMTGICTLLTRLRIAIGDEFKSFIATILPPLLSALAKDCTPNGVISIAVLRTLESFGSLLEEYSKIVLISVARVVTTNRVPATREQAMKTLVRILKEIQSVEIISGVMHSLLLVLSGAYGGGLAGGHEYERLKSVREHSIDWSNVSVLASIAFTVLGTRAEKGFDVFVPVVAKALRASNVKNTCRAAYDSLKAVLMRKDRDIVQDLLSEDSEDDQPFNPEPENQSYLTAISEEFLGEACTPRPSTHGGVLQGYPTLPYGTRTPQLRAHVLEQVLVDKWEVNPNFTAEDWNEWFESVRATMFEQSGSPAFRACGRIADCYPHLIRQLFNAAFLSCWTAELSQSTRTRMCDSLHIALASDTIPLNVLQGILNLFEFMDHDEKPLPVDTGRHASTAWNCGAYAKAIRYREQDYAQHLGMANSLKEDVCGEKGLIAIYEKLGQIESAIGTISHYREHTGKILQEEWFEKLQKWDDALKAYEKTETFLLSNSPIPDGLSPGEALYRNKKSWNHLLGRLRCLNELGEWRSMNSILRKAREACRGNNDALRQLSLEGKGASVAFDLGKWDEFEEWVSFIPPISYYGCFYNSMLLVKRGKDNPFCLVQAQKYVDEARRKLDLELTAQVSEGYPRAYSQVVNAQVLVELEEMIDYLRMSATDAETFGKKRVQSIWTERLKGCQQDWFTWYRLLMIRALVMEPAENKDQWLDFSAMCRKIDRLPMASEALHVLVSSCAKMAPPGNQLSTVQLRSSNSKYHAYAWQASSTMAMRDMDVKFACIKHLWALNERPAAYHALRACCHEFWPGTYSSHTFTDTVDLPNRGDEKQRIILAGEIFSKLSKWGERLLENVADNEERAGEAMVNSEEPLYYAQRATRIRPDWYKAWHYWGVFNATRFESLMNRAAARLKVSDDPTKKAWHLAHRIQEIRPGHTGRVYLTQAIIGFFRSINLQGKTRLEDSLKVLTLWFNYGGHAKLHSEFDERFKETNIAMWLEVVPQIIARLYSSFPGIQRGVRALLTRIGREHPQVAVYPLTVARSAAGSGQANRRRSAGMILDDLKRYHPIIIEQSEIVASELVRAAVLWPELWHERLEEASKLFFNEQNVDGMLDALIPLHDSFEKGAETMCEQDFSRDFGQELTAAGNLCRRFRVEHDNGTEEETLHQYLLKAWKVYHQIFMKLQKQQQSMLVLDIAYVSHRLSEASNLQLAVPGTYNPSKSNQAVGIQAFGSQLHVIQSKQRPRKINIMGSDGYQYQFLLKGHEDLRQDERVMQVFGLMNSLFAKSSKRDILRGADMKQYPVIALSANAGLIGWVPGCDTMHTLVKEYREVRKIMPNVEHKVMLQLAPDPDRLPLLNKVDLFERMLQNTVSADIAKVLWLRSRNSEMWLDIRNTYARSLATTSMAGYLLGLGDRHPSNLMIERSTGKVLHIDFGDCFEVAMKRDKYPEKIPFRLTRMLVQALEPCGVDGYFRHTAEAAMGVLRQETMTESLMAMMEAFVYDPLIRWKLVGVDELVQLQNEVAESRYKVSNRSRRILPRPATITSFRAHPEMQELAKGIQDTGSLAASVRRMRKHKGPVSVALEAESAAGAIPAPITDQANVDDEEIMDLAVLQTPNENARLEQMRILRDGDPDEEGMVDALNIKAQLALNRFEDKLRGTDFGPMALEVKEQVDRLIKEARSTENLCVLFMGWCAFW